MNVTEHCVACPTCGGRRDVQCDACQGHRTVIEKIIKNYTIEVPEAQVPGANKKED